MGLGISEEMIDILMPSIVYWIASGIYTVLGMWFEDYKLHTKEEEGKNRVSKATVVKGILSQQLVHSISNYLLFKVAGGNDAEASKVGSPSYLVIAAQFVVAMVILDTYQYFTHRLLHQNKFLYKHFHATHHRIVVPYAFGAFYSDISALIFINIGGAIAIILTGMSRRAATILFCLATVKLIDDHCGILFPGNPFHIFPNNTAFHDIHHQLYGVKYNFSEPFFIAWDKIMGTYMPYTIEKRAEGGFQVRPIRESKKERWVN